MLLPPNSPHWYSPLSISMRPFSACPDPPKRILTLSWENAAVNLAVGLDLWCDLRGLDPKFRKRKEKDVALGPKWAFVLRSAIMISHRFTLPSGCKCGQMKCAVCVFLLNFFTSCFVRVWSLVKATLLKRAASALKSHLHLCFILSISCVASRRKPGWSKVAYLFFLQKGRALPSPPPWSTSQPKSRPSPWSASSTWPSQPSAERLRLRWTRRPRGTCRSCLSTSPSSWSACSSSTSSSCWAAEEQPTD